MKKVHKQLNTLYTRVPFDLEPEELVQCIDVIGNNQVFNTNNLEKHLALKISVSLLPPLPENEFTLIERLNEELKSLIVTRETAIAKLQSDLSRFPNLNALICNERILAELLHEMPIEQLLTPKTVLNSLNSPLAKLDLITSLPLKLKTKGLKMLGGKVNLAARCDLSSPKDNSVGLKLRKDVERRIDLLLAPPAMVQQRALPKPVLEKTKRRGGQRFRKQRERRKPSALQQRQNIVKFGV